VVDDKNGQDKPNSTIKGENNKSESKGTPVDNLEKEQQPADNDDDETLADNHRKMAKINLKKDEIRKL